LHNNCCQLNFY